MWLIGGVACWMISWGTTIAGTKVAPLIADVLWYVLAVLALAAPVAVLGARRPGHLAWNWFVVLPMLLVLAWPALSTLLSVSSLQGRFLLETPTLLCYALVAVMSVGNYWGTRHSRAATLFLLAIALLLLPLTDYGESWNVNAWYCQSAATLLMGVVGWLVVAEPTRPPTDDFSAWNRVWGDFWDLYGVVWGLRVRDRLNEEIGRSKLPLQVDVDGFHWTAADRQSTTQQELPEQVEQSVRRLLKRFVDAEWIDGRLAERQ